MTAALRACLAVAALLALAGTAIACRRSNAGASAAKTASARSIDRLATSSAPTATANAHGTCATPHPHAPGNETASIESGGLQRSYILHVPPSYDGTRKTPLVLNLHGFGSNAQQQAVYAGLPAKGDRDGFITVSPDGTGDPRHWTYPGLGSVDDVAFVRELLDTLERDLCIDEGWVFTAGMSNGAAFSQVLACALPGRFAAVAAVAALVYQARCDTAPPVAVIGFHGTADPCVPFEGGQTACGQRLPVPAIEDSARNWAQHDGCSAEPARTQVSEHVRSIAYSECEDSTAVLLYVVDGGGHTWPGSIDVARLGATTQEINATDLIWQFFAAQAGSR